ncbi:MAG: PRC-barrel domain-containing protein [Thermoguttaceae bacterium]
MKRFCLISGMLALAACLPVTAAQSEPADSPGRSAEPGGEAAAQRLAVRASELIGMDVYNSEGDALGSVYDIVIDPRSGRVRYAALSYGGFLGFGDKLVAVPWEAFTVQSIQARGEYQLVLNATEEQIKGASGFDQDKWPNFAEPELAEELDAHYGIEREDRKGVDVRIGSGGVDVDVDPRARDREP